MIVEKNAGCEDSSAIYEAINRKELNAYYMDNQILHYSHHHGKKTQEQYFEELVGALVHTKRYSVI